MLDLGCLMTKPQNQDAQIEGLMAENERLRAVIKEAQEAIGHYNTNGSGSIDIDGSLLGCALPFAGTMACLECRGVFALACIAIGLALEACLR